MHKRKNWKTGKIPLTVLPKLPILYLLAPCIRAKVDFYHVDNPHVSVDRHNHDLRSHIINSRTSKGVITLKIINKYIHPDESERAAAVQQINRRCTRQVHAQRTQSKASVVITALPVLMASKKEG